nr:cation diffusion facilitator family transporter [Sphingobium sp. EM0848]
MTNCGCEPIPADTQDQRPTLWTALALNALMFAMEVGGGITINSTGLVADGLDMLSDACVYAIALAAIGRSSRFKANAATISGFMLLLLGAGLVIDVIRRLFEGGSPQGAWMIAISLPALAVNIIVLRLLARQRSKEVHMRAAWIFTRADIIANAAVILSGIAVLATQIHYFDLAVGAAIGAYVIKEAFEILSEARTAKASSRT